MKTGVELITEIGTLSFEIAEIGRFITSHPMTRLTTLAYVSLQEKQEQRELLRKDLAELPDLTFS